MRNRPAPEQTSPSSHCILHQRPPCRQHNPKGNRSASCWCCSWSTAATLHSPPHVELQRRNHHKSHGKVPSQHPCGEASHSHRPTAASRCRWLQSTVAAVSSRCPNGVGRGTRTARWSVRHAAALQRLSAKQSRPTVPTATQCAINPNTATLSPLFCFIQIVCLFAPSPTQKISAHLHKREGTKKWRHDPTVTPRVNTLLHPPPSPHRRPQSHRRVNTTMCTTPSCSERWARRGQASPRSIFPPLKYCVPTQTGKQNQSAHKPNQHPHSLKHIIRME
ncbi:hypothetical protein TCSYLVIO_006696 [Trypanosoma cruzi]|nr:hypothetical protein TCSYLVIO_006696 [Trypanosoma cruzi]